MKMFCTMVIMALALSACGKKEVPPVTDAATVAPPTTAPPAEDVAAAPDTAPAEDTAPAADTAPAEDTAPAAEDTAPAAEDTAPTAEDTAPAIEFTPVKAPEKPFHDLNDEERKTYMKEAVVPAMRERFQAYDPTEYAKFGCGTCHGKEAKERKFKMPNPDIEKLPTSKEAWDEYMKTADMKMLEFMGKTVVPTMATLLGEEPFNLETGKGFGCFECHMKKE